MTVLDLYRRTATHAAGAMFLLSAVALPLGAQTPDQITEKNIISGSMNITFNTRTEKDTTGNLLPDSPALAAKDVYDIKLSVATTTEFVGTITRLPNLYSAVLQRREQEARLEYDLTLNVLNPRDLNQKRTVGKWVGLVPIDTATGQYDLAAGQTTERPLRMAVDTVGAARGFTDNFGGRLVGKAEKKEGLSAYTYRRLVGGRTVEVVVKHSDPLQFTRLKLAKGPAEIYASTIVNGRLDYDYETANWFTDGITFAYTVNGTEFTDKVTGSIKWVEDPDYETNGKGCYEFNLRFNEDANKPASSEADMFGGMSDEEAFFAVDDTIPSLTGTICYVDAFVPGTDTVSSSKVTYNLHANKLTKQQVVNFFKLWVLCIGPTNDD